MIAIAVDERPARADPASSLAALAAVVVAIGGVAMVAGSPRFFVLTSAALAVGVVLGMMLPDRSLFDAVSGVGAAFLLFAAGLLLLGVAASSMEFERPPPPEVLLVCVLVVGLDWDRVVRLRVRVLASGAWLVPALAIADEPGDALPLGLVWFAVACTALWLLQRDGVGVVARATPLAPQPARSGLRPMELLGVAGASAAIALLLALLVGVPSCSLFPDESDVPSDLSDSIGDPDLGGSGGSGGSGSGTGSASGGGSGSGGASGGSGSGSAGPVDSGSLYYDGNEAYRYDPEAGRYYRDPANDYGFKDPNGDVWVPAENGKPLPPGAEIGDGEVRDGRLPSGGSDGSGGEVGTGDQADDRDRDSPSIAGLLAALATLGVLGVIGYLLWRRWGGGGPDHAPRSWAEDATHQLQEEGRRRGRRRADHEPVATYARALGAETGDARLAAVGAVVSAALFASTPPEPSACAWVDAVLAELAEAELTEAEVVERVPADAISS